MCWPGNCFLACAMRMPGVKPGSQAWEACMMPLHYMRHGKIFEALFMCKNSFMWLLNVPMLPVIFFCDFYIQPGSNWQPSACEADVIATRPWMLIQFCQVDASLIKMSGAWQRGKCAGAVIAQLAVRRSHNPKVVSSILTHRKSSTRTRSIQPRQTKHTYFSKLWVLP